MSMLSKTPQLQEMPMQKSMSSKYVLDPPGPQGPPEGRKFRNSGPKVIPLPCISQNASAYRPALDSDTDTSGPDLQTLPSQWTEKCALPCFVPEHDRKDPAEAARELL